MIKSSKNPKKGNYIKTSLKLVLDENQTS